MLDHPSIEERLVDPVVWLATTMLLLAAPQSTDGDEGLRCCLTHVCLLASLFCILTIAWLSHIKNQLLFGRQDLSFSTALQKQDLARCPLRFRRLMSTQ